MTDVFCRTYSPLSDEQKCDMDWIKHKAEKLLAAMEAPAYADPRLKAMAKSYLEVAVMCAGKGVANPPVKE